MTEQEWTNCSDPLAMASSHILYPIWGGSSCAEVARSKRKRYLCCVAWIRTVWNLLESEHSRHCVEVVEQYVEGNATERELDEALWMAKDGGEDSGVTTEAQIWASEAVADIGGLTESLGWLTLCSDQAQQPVGGRTLFADLL